MSEANLNQEAIRHEEKDHSSYPFSLAEALRQVYNNSPVELTTVHLLENICQFLQLLCSNMRLYNPAGNEVEHFKGVSSISHGGSLD